MLIIKEHKIIAIRKNKNQKIHIKYVKDGIGKSLCGNFQQHENFEIDNLANGVDSLRAVLKEDNMCKRCLKIIEDNIEAHRKGLAFALEMVYVEQSFCREEDEDRCSIDSCRTLLTL